MKNYQTTFPMWVGYDVPLQIAEKVAAAFNGDARVKRVGLEMQSDPEWVNLYVSVHAPHPRHPELNTIRLTTTIMREYFLDDSLTPAYLHKDILGELDEIIATYHRNRRVRPAGLPIHYIYRQYVRYDASLWQFVYILREGRARKIKF